MPAQATVVPKQVEDAQKQIVKGNKNDHQTPIPPKRKSSKPERASMLCSTPPTCIKDRAAQVEYTRKEFLGEGGFARCYLVTNRQGRPFAAKVVAKASLKTPKAKGKLIGEIKVHQSLQHPNIVRYQECFEDKSNVYIILELCENKSLLEMLRRRKLLTEPEVRFFMLQILGATKYMHEKRVIHRDLKLGNLFLDDRMNIKLGDFGLAALLVDDNERKRTICGTPNYIAPEVLCNNGDGHSYEVDLWSIGVIMYALLVGKPPFQAKEVKMIYKKIKNNQYNFPETNPISEEAQDLIASLLCPDPNNRPSIDEISDHKFFHTGEMPREIPLSTLQFPPTWNPISKPMSELNWRYISVQAGLGKNIQVGQDAGKSVQVCIAMNENPLKSHVARLRQDETGTNVLPMTLSPRVPAPGVGGLAESKLLGKGTKRSLKRLSSEDKENELPLSSAGSLRKKIASGKHTATRAGVQYAFPDVPEEANDSEEPAKAPSRRMPPPLRKPTGNIPLQSSNAQVKPTPIVCLPSSSQQVAQRESQTEPNTVHSGAKRTLRKAQDSDSIRPPTQAEINVPSRVPPRIQTQRSTLKRTITQTDLRQSAQELNDGIVSSPRLLRTRPSTQSASSNTNIAVSESKIGSKIPVKLQQKGTTDHQRLVEALREMADNLALALNTPSTRLSSQFHRQPLGPPTFVTRWVDYTGKYGLAYQLSNSLAGMYFNDSTSIVLSLGDQTFDYLSATGETISGTIGKHSTDLEKKVKLTLRYQAYMTDNLQSVEQPSAVQSEATRIFVTDFRRASNAVLFRMSGDVFQMNFADHSKVVLWDSARAVRYVDKRGEVYIWSLSEAVTKRSKGEVIERLKLAAKELVAWADLMVSGKKGRKM